MVGALELVDKEGGGTFSFDDLEMATLLGSIAGTALKEGTGAGRAPPTPSELARSLASPLYGVEPTDPVTFIVVSPVLIAVAFIESCVHWSRASKVGPKVTLR